MITITTIVLWALVALGLGFYAGCKATILACGKIVADEIDRLETAAGLPSEGLPSERWASLPYRLAALRAKANRA